MKTMKLWRIAFMMLAAFSLASCSSDDDNEDKVEQVTLYVSAETGTYQNVPDNNYVASGTNSSASCRIRNSNNNS